MLVGEGVGLGVAVMVAVGVSAGVGVAVSVGSGVALALGVGEAAAAGAGVGEPDGAGLGGATDRTAISATVGFSAPGTKSIASRPVLTVVVKTRSTAMNCPPAAARISKSFSTVSRCSLTLKTRAPAA